MTAKSKCPNPGLWAVEAVNETEGWASFSGTYDSREEAQAACDKWMKKSPKVACHPEPWENFFKSIEKYKTLRPKGAKDEIPKWDTTKDTILGSLGGVESQQRRSDGQAREGAQQAPEGKPPGNAAEPPKG